MISLSQALFLGCIVLILRHDDHFIQAKINHEKRDLKDVYNISFSPQF